METVIIVIHLMVIAALIAVVLLQRSEGGALGVGGSSQFMTARGQGNVLTRATTILGMAFFATSLAMTVLSRMQTAPSSILDTVQTPANAPAGTPAGTPSTGTGGILDELNRFTGQTGQGQSAPAAPPATAPAAPPDAPGTPAQPTTPAQPQVPTTQ